jgi:hypothetical protein
MDKFLGSKKTKGYIVGLLSTGISTYVLKDNPELAEKIATLIVGLASAYLLSQGVADGFGGDSYNKK